MLELGRRLIYNKLPKRTRDVLAMPPAAQRKLLEGSKETAGSTRRPVN